jgi:CheY-like chemotaxis protein/anti-sigma regulatory factor (Ser/Thr protein kinase)
VTVTVLLVDDVPELRQVVRQALTLRGGFEVVAEAGDGAGGIAAAGEWQPDVVVLDLGLPDLAGREVVTGIRSVAPAAQIVIYTGSMAEDRSGVMAQVAGYVRKDQELSYLINLLADLSRRDQLAATIGLGPDHRDVARGRQFLADLCRRWGCADVVERGALVVTELVTNALIHTGSSCELRARLAEQVLRVEVVDDGAGVPDLQAAGREDEHGRGLLLVSALSAAWGVEARPEGGKLVWAELMVSPGATGGGAPDDVTAAATRESPGAAPAGPESGPAPPLGRDRARDGRPRLLRPMARGTGARRVRGHPCPYGRAPRHRDLCRRHRHAEGRRLAPTERQRVAR